MIHWEAPTSVEAYLQEAGRAGRDKEPAEAVLILGHDEEGRTALDGGEREGRRLAFLAWAREGQGCRRAGLLALLGSTLEGTCGGCDRCDGTAKGEREGAAEVGRFVRLHPRRWTLQGAVERLGSMSSFRGRRDFPVPGEGSLAGWTESEIAEALRAGLKLGMLRERTGRPWKGRLEPGPEPTAAGAAAIR